MDIVRISVVVTTFDRSAMLRDALESLVRQRIDERFRYEIVVVDNASTDDTCEVVQEFADREDVPPIHYHHESRQGQAFALNRGIEEAPGEWLAFFDDDQVAPPHWLGALLAIALERGAWVVGGPIELDLPESVRKRIGPICRDSLREIHFYDEVHSYSGRHLPGSGNVLVSRRLFETIGVYDTSMSRGAYDIDLFIRARAAGIAMWYTPDGFIRHRIPAYRLELEYFRWDALKTGENLAWSDHRYKGSLSLSLLSLARLGQALFLNLPRYGFERLRCRDAEATDRRTLLWRAEGYVRRALSLLLPGLFPQRRFMEAIEFRNGRVLETAAARKPEAPTIVVSDGAGS